MKGKRFIASSSSSDLDRPSKRQTRNPASSSREEVRTDTGNTDHEMEGEDQQRTDQQIETDTFNYQTDKEKEKDNENAHTRGDVTNDGLIANMVMKILTRLNPAEIAAFRHQRQQTHAYGRAAAFPCFEQISPDIWAVVAGLVSCNTEMWEGESSTRRYLDPLRYQDDLTVLRRLININEQTFLDMLLDNYPGHKDQNPNAMFAQALSHKMPTTFNTKTDITRLNETFGKLQNWCHKGNFTVDQEHQICLSIKNQLDPSNPIHQRVINHVFKQNFPSSVGELASYVMAFAIEEEQHVASVRARGYVVSTPDTVNPTPGPSGLTADGTP